MHHDLDRFVTAQSAAFAAAIAELRRGRKATHWMWFVFPQLCGLGRSDTARFYGVASLDEARAYLNHPLLGARLIEATAAIAAASGTAQDILGSVDALKLRSSMTLFASAADDPAPFVAALDRFYDGVRDPATLALLGATPAAGER